MRIFIVADNKRYPASLLLSKYLQRRVGTQATIECGGMRKLKYRTAIGKKYDFGLNLGTQFVVPSSFKILNNTTFARAATRNRFICRTRAKSAKLPAPKMVIGLPNITNDMYPVLARTTLAAEDNIQILHTRVQLETSLRKGYTHFVQQALHCKTYKVHIFSPRTDLNETKPSEFKVVKMSQLMHIRNLNFIGLDLRKYDGHYFGAIPENKKCVRLVLRKAAQNLMRKFGLHWAAITYVIGKDGVPLLIKVDNHINLHEDQNGLLPLYSKAFCEMLGLKVKPLIQRSRSSYVKV